MLTWFKGTVGRSGSVLVFVTSVAQAQPNPAKVPPNPESPTPTNPASTPLPKAAAMPIAATPTPVTPTPAPPTALPPTQQQTTVGVGSVDTNAASAEAGGVTGEKSPCVTAGPRFVGVLPARYDKPEIEAAVGQELRLALVVDHPQGLPMKFEALGLPHRAEFDPELRSIVWRPTDAELGVYQVRIVASDGVREASHTLLISVVGNRPPQIGSLWFETVVGQPSTLVVQTRDPEGAQVAVQLEGLPAGATFDPVSGRIQWVPTEAQVGVHPISVSASDGQSAATASGQITVRREGTDVRREEWTSYLLPGAGYAMYFPRKSALVDVFHGVNLELVLAAWIHRNNNRGPSHGRVYVNVELLSANESDVPLMFTYSGGLSLSFERNPQRTWLVPHYGVELGGLIHREIGAYFQAQPYLGLHLYSSPNVFLGLRAGYRLVPRRIDELAGIHAALSADFSIW